MSARLAAGDDGGLGGGGGDGALGALRSAVAGDLRLLALLHDRELDAERIHALWAEGYEDFLLTHGLRASPCESVWLDEDGLAMQAPMFDVREWYQRYGLAVANWRQRSDDHLVYQLLFLAHLLEPEGDATAGDVPATGTELGEVARFMDEHTLLWIDRFADRVAKRCETRFYAGLALLTAAYLNELRDLLAELADAPRPSAEEMEARRRPRSAVSVPVAPPSAFVPGAGPTW